MMTDLVFLIAMIFLVVCFAALTVAWVKTLRELEKSRKTNAELRDRMNKLEVQLRIAEKEMGVRW